MRSKEVRIVGPNHDLRAFVISVPDIDRGFFVSRYSTYRDVGELAIISGIEVVAAEQIAAGDVELFNSYHEMDLELPGRMNMRRGASISVINGTVASQTVSNNVLILEGQYGSRWLDEYEPRIPDRYKVS